MKVRASDSFLIAAMFLVKRGAINIFNSYNSARSVTGGVTTISSSRYFTSHGNNGREKSKEEATGTTTDGKAPNVTLNHAADTARDGLKQATDAAIKKSGDSSKPASVENKEGDDGQENVAVGDDGTIKGQNQSSG